MSDTEKGTAVVVTLFLAVLLTTVIALSLWEAKAREYCLEKGFPKYTRTWNFRVFCIGYDGAVHPVVEERK